MTLLEKYPRFDDLGFAIFLFAPVSLLLLSAVTTEALSARLPHGALTLARAAQHQIVNTGDGAAQTPCPTTAPRTALAGGLIGKSSHE